jgi:hypothetical protein
MAINLNKAVDMAVDMAINPNMVVDPDKVFILGKLAILNMVSLDMVVNMDFIKSFNLESSQRLLRFFDSFITEHHQALKLLQKDKKPLF